MNELADVAQRLRIVREAHRKFLKLYAVQIAVIEPALDRVADDVMAADADDVNPFTDAGDDPDDGTASPGW